MVNVMQWFFFTIIKKVKGCKKICHTNTNQKQAGVAMLVTKVDFRGKSPGKPLESFALFLN